jgi:hypothetical protein
VVAADALVDILQDVLVFFPGNTLHEYARRCAPPVELVSDEDVGLGTVDELLGQVLDRGNLLLAEVVDEGLPPVHVDHHDLLASREMCWVSGRWRRLRDGWCVKLVNDVTPDFPNKTKCISYVRQDQVYTHMIDVMSEISINNNKNVQELNHYIISLLHSDVKLKGLYNDQTITKKT